MLPQLKVGISLNELDGLSAEMLFSRSEKDGGFSPYPKGGAEMKFCTDRPLFSESPRYLKLTAKAGCGIEHRALLNLNGTYELCFYARSYESRGKIEVDLFERETLLFWKRFKLRPDGKWRKYSAKLKGKSSGSARLSLRLLTSGSVHLDALSLLPENAIKDVFRRDLSELLKEIRPSFLRFPCTGGFKRDFVPFDRRKGSKVGVFDCFRLSEYVGAKPVPEFLETCEDALDLIEFAIGPLSSEWGRARAELNHPEPFALEACDVSLLSDSERERIHKKYPSLILLGEGEKQIERVLLSPQALFERETLKGAVEFAAQSPDPFLNALSEAAFLAGLEQRGEVFASHLNLLGKDGLISFDNKGAYPAFGYHVQKLFSLYGGSRAIATETTGTDVFASASEREGLTFLKIVNLGEEQSATVEGYDFGEMTRILRLESDRDWPFEVAPVEAHALTLPPRSFSLIVFRK